MIELFKALSETKRLSQNCQKYKIETAQWSVVKTAVHHIEKRMTLSIMRTFLDPHLTPYPPGNMYTGSMYSMGRSAAL